MLFFMKKIATVLLLSLLCMGYLPMYAQFKIVAEGPEFEEPEEGFAKILQLKNGNTFYIHITPKDGINIRVYDINKKEKVSTISPSYDNLKGDDVVESVFEINNKVMVFLNKSEDRVIKLYRLIIDGTTGKLVQQKVIAERQKFDKEILRYHNPFPNQRELQQFDFFSIRKDQYSDNYAIAAFNDGEPDATKRLEIIHFDSDNNEINRKFCFLKNSTNCRFIDMAVIGTEKVCAFVVFTDKKELKNHMMALIEKGVPEIIFTDLPISNDIFSLFKEAEYNLYWRKFFFGTAKYNPVSHKIIYLETGIMSLIKHLSWDSRKVDCFSTLHIIDPEKLKTQSIPNFKPAEKLNVAYKEILDIKQNYNGIPQKLIVKDDGSFTVVFEETVFLYDNSGNGTDLGSIAVSAYNQDGALKSEYLIPKSHFIINHRYSPLYLSERELGAQKLFKGNQFKSFDIIDAPKNEYILFNDSKRNNDVENARKTTRFGTGNRTKLIKVIGVTAECDAFMYKLTGTDVLPKREYLFAEMDKERALALLTISDYNKKNNTYATLMLDKKNIISKMVSIVWQEPD